MDEAFQAMKKSQASPPTPIERDEVLQAMKKSQPNSPTVIERDLKFTPPAVASITGNAGPIDSSEIQTAMSSIASGVICLGCLMDNAKQRCGKEALTSSPITCRAWKTRSPASKSRRCRPKSSHAGWS